MRTVLLARSTRSSEDPHIKDIGYMRGDPHEQHVRRLVAQLKNLGVDIRHVNHQMIVETTRKVTVEKTGIVIT